MVLRGKLGLVLLGLLPLGPAQAQVEEGEPTRPTIYKWVDENGVAHYTADPERIPEELRDRLRLRTRERREGAGSSRAGADAADWASQDASPEDADASDTGDGVPEPSSSDRDPGTAAQLRRLERRIAGLEAEIRRDEERLKVWVSDPQVDPVLLADDPEFREIAARLPRLQEDLRQLEQERRRRRGEEP